MARGCYPDGNLTLLPNPGPAGKVPIDLEGFDDEADEAAVFAGVQGAGGCAPFGAGGDAGSIYNVCDDLPAERGNVVAFVCELLGLEAPEPIPYAEAMPPLSPMARSFWQDNRRVDNARMKCELGIQLQYPYYRTGLSAILAAEEVPPLLGWSEATGFATGGAFG